MALDLCKYYKKQKYVSYNDGQTWQPLDEFEKGELYEAHSASCGAGVFQYRWVLINNGYICDSNDKYTREVYQYSEDGTVWYNLWPTVYRKGTLVETNSPFCDNAGNGQYTSGDTEPISGDTPCPEGYEWNGYDCICTSVTVGGYCISCYDHTYWNSGTSRCECVSQWKEVERIDDFHPVCVYVDPLKNLKCDGEKYQLTAEDVNYYENGWAVISYNIGDCITEIADGAFNGQVYMTNVTIPSSVVKVGSLAFGNCRSLSTIEFPSSLETLGYMAFASCSNLKNVTFGGTIPSAITSSLFSQCTSLESATWLQYSNVVSIGSSAFHNCYSLSGVVLPNTLETIGTYAFYSCKSLENITIPSGVTSIGEGAFTNCSGMTFANINSNNITIGSSAFQNCSRLTAATFESSAVTMGSNVFSGCTSLLKLTFTSPTPFTIEEGEFDNTNDCMIFVPCESEEAYKTAWAQYADRISCNDTGVYYRWVDVEGTYCVGYDEYTREKKQSTTNGISWTDTGDYRIKDLITHYSENCGYSDEVALTVTHSDGITRYYEACNEQPILDVNKLVANYSDNTTYTLACNGDSDLLQNEIRDYSSSYSSMTSAVVGNCVTYIGESGFTKCISLSSVTLPNSVVTIGNFAFQDCSGLTSVTIPDSVTIIGDYSYQWCRSLSSITIPDSVEYIGGASFWECSNLTNCIIGSGVTSIGYGAFYGCNRLISITVNAITPPTLVGRTFDNNDCPIYVPAASLDAYKLAWNSYATRIQAIPN